MIAGANKNDYHLRNVTPGEDFQCRVSRPAPGRRRRRVRSSTAAPLTVHKTIEIGHIFKLGYKYSESMGLRVLDEAGKEVTPIMGSYGIGIERILCAAVELYHDKDGIVTAGLHRAFHCGRHARQFRRRRAARSRDRNLRRLRKRWASTRCSTIATSVRASSSRTPI